MGGGKETGRQKMIGMMYLVLTALLALNVAKDILDAFVVLNEGLHNTEASFKAKIEGEYHNLEKSYAENPVKVQKAWDAAQIVKMETDELVAEITIMKGVLMAMADNLPLEAVMGPNENGIDTLKSLQLVEAKDNYDITSRWMEEAPLLTPDVELPDGRGPNILNGYVLVEKLEAYRESMLALVGKSVILKMSLNKTFSFPEIEKGHESEPLTWVHHTFYHSPVAAVVTILSKVQTDLRGAEADVLAYLMESVDASSFKFNKLKAAVIPNSTYLNVGDSFKAQVFIAAFDTTKSPQMVFSKGYAGEMDGLESYENEYGEGEIELAGDTSVVKVINGLGRIAIPSRGEGEFEWKGLINYKAPSGAIKHYPFQVSYKVSNAGAVVSPTKMNVFYKGLSNPVSVSIPGVSNDQIQVSAPAGVKLSGSNGNYEVVITNQALRKAKLTVSAKMPNGKVKSMGDFEFRVFKIPDPVPQLIGKGPETQAIALSTLKGANFLVADLKDFLFEGVKYNVTGFTLNYESRGISSEFKTSNQYLTAEMKGYIQTLKQGKTITFSRIKCVGPDNSERDIGSLVFKVI
ncbi:MAG: gliding motility-associated protein GldM [Sphingobacteriales bacterium]|jgi:gliding motility-associated protein GldM